MPERSAFEGIVVLGSPRSGTTLIRRLLNGHPDINCPPETNLLNSAARFLEEHEFAGGLSVGVIPGLDFCGFDEQAVLDRLREFVFSFHRELRDQAGKRYWAEKTAFDIFHLDAVEKLCVGHCRFICVTRHALDVCVSIRDLTDEMQMYLPELHQYIKRYPAPLEAFAHAWVDVNQRLLRFIDCWPNVCHRPRYESLVSEPQSTLQSLFEWLQLTTDVPALLDAAMSGTADVGLGDWKTYRSRRIDSGRTQRWKELPADRLARLAAIVNPTLEQLGYDAVQADAQLSGADARRRYQISQKVAQMGTAKERGT